MEHPITTSEALRIARELDAMLEVYATCSTRDGGRGVAASARTKGHDVLFVRDPDARKPFLILELIGAQSPSPQGDGINDDGQDDRREGAAPRSLFDSGD